MVILVGAAIGGAYWLHKHHEGQDQIDQLPPMTNPPMASLPMASLPGGFTTLVIAPLPPAIAAAAPAPDPVAIQALLSWSAGTGNPSLYFAWINQLSPTDVNNMYDILVNDWMASGRATPTQTSNWNDLVNRYPFLKVPQSMVGGCNNFNCS